MANGHGGPRTPAHPAAVSPPGALSRRTDGHPSQIKSAAPGQDYGAATQQLQAQSVAPMAGQTPLPSPAAPQPQGGAGAHQMPQFNGPSLSDPTQRPNEPITTGSAIGPGAGPEALTFQPVTPGQGTGQMTQLLQRLSATDTTGILGQLMQAAQAHGA